MLSVFKLADSDLRPLQVGHDRDVASELGRSFANQFCALRDDLRLSRAKN